VAQKETFLYEQGRLEKGEPQVFWEGSKHLA
jgi:hypothetical protein